MYVLLNLLFLTLWQEEELKGAVVLIFANKQVMLLPDSRVGGSITVY